MHNMNAYFTPFAVLLTVFAIYFSALDKKTAAITFAVLLTGFALNLFLAKNEYRLFKWIHKIRVFTVFVNLAVTTAIFYLIGSFWAPSWLLYLIAPAGAAMFMGKSATFAISSVSAALMLGVYFFKSRYFGLPLGQTQWAMASIHAIFVVVFSMFVNSMANMAVKIRDSLSGR